MASDSPLPISDYAVIGDMASAALVGRNGSIDWLCWPRFDSGACMAGLLGGPEYGQWQIGPADDAASAERAYHTSGLVLETRFETADGSAALIDFMVPGEANSTVVRIVRGLRGQIRMRVVLRLRFDYGLGVPWVSKLSAEDGPGLHAVAGPDQVVLRAPVQLHGHHMASVADFVVEAGESVPFVLRHGPSHLALPPPLDAEDALTRTDLFWSDWSAKCTYHGPWRDQVQRSLLTLKLLTYAPTGGIVAAVTTSLPELLGGGRNWDYRICWLRDASITLFAFMSAGYGDEAKAWSDWLARSVAGSVDQIQIMYGIGGERLLPERELEWLPGYAESTPVRVGNAAATQLQLDVYGELATTFHLARGGKLLTHPHAWSLQRKTLDHLETVWDQPDEGIWEVRGGRKQFTFSKVSAWVAFDRAICDAETFGLPAPLDRWRAIRDQIHREVCERGYDRERGHFRQHFDTSELDASLLLLPMIGFLPYDDSRIRGTIEAIERDLVRDGLVRRYRTEQSGDGLSGGEGAFIACSFWLASALHGLGRCDDARALFERLLGLCNDVGLLTEEYDPRDGRALGNFPQAFSHVSLIAAAIRLSDGATRRVAG